MNTDRLKVIQNGRPAWWHSFGNKMQVVAEGFGKDLLVLQGSAAELVVRQDGHSWEVRWLILLADGKVHGRLDFTREELVGAFGIGSMSPELEPGVVTEQGKFIRFKNWLNIPCAGTGHDGDPNISIEVNEEIRAAMNTMLFASRR